MSGREFQCTSAEAKEIAEAKGCVCKTPRFNELFIDLDEEKPPAGHHAPAPEESEGT